MPRHYPLTCKQVKKILRRSGFEPQDQGATSHQHWKKIVKGKLFKVTVDCPNAPFSHDLVKSMAKQAGMSQNDFYAVIDPQFKKKKRRK